jgi:hypothetical protein
MKKEKTMVETKKTERRRFSKGRKEEKKKQEVEKVKEELRRIRKREIEWKKGGGGKCGKITDLTIKKKTKIS